jgi:hypothetical protein
MKTKLRSPPTFQMNDSIRHLKSHSGRTRQNISFTHHLSPAEESRIFL